jgi:hypothetical protein
MARLRECLERGDIDGAREFVRALHERWPDSERVRHFIRVLAPPIARVVPGSGGRSLRKEHAWLKEHAREYPGCWIAVLDGRLIAADPHLETVLSTVAQTPGAEAGLLHFQPGG